MKRLILFPLLMAASAAWSTENSLNNVLNNNGSVGNVTINQSNVVTNEQIDSQLKIDEAIQNALKSNDVNTISIASIANQVNQKNANLSQKNKICKSQVKVSADIIGYNVDFGFGKCDQFFTARK
ncbi:hypothetical protein ACK1CN_25650 [Vibrio coralliilyticus]|uniref:hypothetical protein n=1 Tax=Vibrio coralliilyticus TaxID=190893 RepID=UPI0039174C54